MNDFSHPQLSDTLRFRADLVTTERERAAIFAIRNLVFVVEQAVPPEEEIDAYDTDAIHFLAEYSDDTAVLTPSFESSAEASIEANESNFESKSNLESKLCAEPKNLLTTTIIGTARLVDKGNGIGKIGRVAILRQFRGLGIGAMLMRYIEETARNRGFTTLVLEAQCYAITFYEKLGYVAEGEVFLDANIEHRHMHKIL